MKKNEKLTVLGGAAGMLLLILDGKTALLGANEGMELCIRTVIPALFPFFVFSSVLTGSLRGDYLRPLGALFGIPKGTEGLLVPGILGGYPAGAQGVYQAYQGNQISKGQAERMLSFCNNAGPSFLFGMIAPQFDIPAAGWLLWGIHLLGAVLVSRLFPVALETDSGRREAFPITLPQALNKGLRTTGIVCGWVILFRILITFLNRWILWLLPTPAQVFVSGILELSNGCCSLNQIENMGLRFILCAAMLGFGGLCVTMQTASVTGGLNLRFYYQGKMLQALISIAAAYLVQLTFPESIRISGYWFVIFGLFMGFLLFYFLKQKISSSNPRPVRV